MNQQKKDLKIQKPILGTEGRILKKANKKISKAKSKPVLCIELNQVFSSVKQAKIELGISGIDKVCRGNYSQAGGYHFTYINDTFLN